MAWASGLGGTGLTLTGGGGHVTRAGLVLVGLMLPLAGLGIARTGTNESEGVNPQHRSDIRALYLKDCGICHGSDGRGTKQGPSLVDSGAAAVDFQISTGRMPLPSPHAESVRRTPKYRPATIRELVAYVQVITAGGGPPIPNVDPRAGSVAEGGQLFRRQCAACHAWSGEGGALVEREAPKTQSATPTQIAEAVRTGPTNMPRFGAAAIADDQLNSLVAYTLYLDKPRDRGGEPLWHLGPLAEGAAAGLLGLGTLLLVCRWIGTRT